MIASLLLSVCVIGVSGTILSSYAHDQKSKQLHDAARSAESMREELSALPITAASSSDVGLMDFASYSDQSSGDQLVVASAAKESSKQTAAGTAGTPTATTSNTGLLGAVVGLVNGLLGGSSSSSSSGSSGSSGGSGSSSSSSSSSATASAVVNANATPSLTSSRVVQVQRVDALNGATSSSGALAIVTIDATVGGTTVRVKRLVSTTEAAANAGGGTVQ